MTGTQERRPYGPLEETNTEYSEINEHDTDAEKAAKTERLVKLIESCDFAHWTRRDDKKSDRELIGERYAQ